MAQTLDVYGIVCQPVVPLVHRSVRVDVIVVIHHIGPGIHGCWFETINRTRCFMCVIAEVAAQRSCVTTHRVCYFRHHGRVQNDSIVNVHEHTGDPQYP